jgi:hypothetical protein
MSAAANAPDTIQGPTVVARLDAGAADAARTLLDQLAEVFDASEAVVSAYDGSGGWTVAIHFNEPPNETAVRALVGLAAGAEAANALTFETLGAKDWVKASQEGLKPVEAGRFIVHSEHYRTSVRVNRIGIEIGTAFAFGTGHHGTTRGCLLARNRGARDRGGADAAPPGAGKRHRPPLHAGGARERQTQSRANGDGGSCRRSRHAAVSRPGAVRPRAGQYPALAAATDGNAGGAAARARRARRPLRPADLAGQRRARGVSQ